MSKAYTKAKTIAYHRTKGANIEIASPTVDSSPTVTIAPTANAPVHAFASSWKAELIETKK